MWSYIARQPILYSNKELYGYELLFRDGEKNAFPGIPDEEATSRLIVEQQFDGDIRNLVGDKLAFINFSRDSLIEEHPKLLPPRNVVIEVLETVEPDDEIIAVCKDLKGRGYRLALDDHDFNKAWHPWVHLFDIIKIDITQFSRTELTRLLAESDFQSVQMLAERVETEEEFSFFQCLGFSLFQGYFFAKPQMIRKQAMPANKLSIIQLLALVSMETVDFDELVNVISMDPGLSFKLLRFINSVSFALSRKISSLKQALVYLGQKEIKKFVALVSLASLGGADRIAAISLAASRAIFCDAIAGLVDDKQIKNSAFLIGLFSMIDTLLEDSMENILQLLPVDDAIRDALLENEGLGAEILQLAKYFEAADWLKIAEYGERFGVSETQMNECYQQAMSKASSLVSPDE